jgi:hypothetical protein
MFKAFDFCIRTKGTKVPAGRGVVPRDQIAVTACALSVSTDQRRSEAICRSHPALNTSVFRVVKCDWGRPWHCSQLPGSYSGDSGIGRVGENVRFAAASDSARFYLAFDCGRADFCRGAYCPESLMRGTKQSLLPPDPRCVALALPRLALRSGAIRHRTTSVGCPSLQSCNSIVTS